MNCNEFVCVWETRCHTVRSRHKIRVFENKVVIKEEERKFSHDKDVCVFASCQSLLDI